MRAVKYISLILAFCWVTEVKADEINVFCASALEPALAEFAPAHERATGDKVRLDCKSLSENASRIGQGAPDVVMVAPEDYARLSAAGKLTDGVIVAKSGKGFGIRPGQALQPVDNVRDFHDMLERAKGIAVNENGASGKYFLELVGRQHWTDIEKKLVKTKSNEESQKALADGRADIIISQAPEIIGMSDVQFAGRFPEDIQQDTIVMAAIPDKAAHRDAAKRFIDALSSPEAKAVMSKKGLM